MPRFSRTTILELVDALHFTTHTQIEEFAFRFGLDDIPGMGGIHPKSMAITRHLHENQDDVGPDGANIVLEIIEHLFERQKHRSEAQYYDYDDSALEEAFPMLMRSLRRDGYVAENGKLKTLLPSQINLPEMEDKLTALLEDFEFDTAKGHLLQARSAHTRGEWAAANAQLRTFMESLFDSIAESVSDGTACSLDTSNARREYLAKTEPPFFLAPLNEWDTKGRGFVQGLWRRLHPEGSHPGLSDEDDSTFRLHLVLLTAVRYLSRLRDRKGD